MARRIWDTKCTQLFLVLIDGEFRYAQLKEIGLEECGEKYDHFLRRSRKKAKLTTDQLCAGDDKVKKWYTSHNWYLIYIVIINSILLLTDWLKRFLQFAVFQADACGGDSGGPLLHLNADYSWMVVGIVSFGPSSCAREVPGVYTKVANYLPWIKENTGLNWNLTTAVYDRCEI